jgi:hypothetical protein
MKNKLRRLADFIQEGFPEKLVDAFKSEEKPTLATRIQLTCAAITFHQSRAEALWREAGKKRTPEERRAVAQAELASFVFAYLTGEAKEHRESAILAMQALGRQGEVDIIKSLSRR